MYQASLTSTFFTPPVASPRLRDLTPETDGPRTRGLLASTSWLKGTFVTETEVLGNQGGVGWFQEKIPNDVKDDASSRMVRLGFSGTAGIVRYGMLYRAWDLQNTRQWTTLISMEAGYNRMTNRVTPSTDTEDLSGLVRLVLAAL